MKVNLQENRLTISGERHQEKIDNQNFFRKERFYGRFMRTFTLPTTVEENNIKAKFNDGVLTVTVPKAEVKKAKRIAIE